MNDTRTIHEKALGRFLDDKNIQTGEDLEGSRLLLVETSKDYDLVEKLHSLAISLTFKGCKLNEFLEYFYVLDPDCIHFSESYYYCDGCSKYARHYEYEAQDQYYINTDTCEVVCRNCVKDYKEEYIEYLQKHKKLCTLLSEEELIELDYVILEEYNFNNDMYGGRQADKEEIDKVFDKEDIKIFYWLHTSHMFGIWYTIIVHKNDLEKAKQLLEEKFSDFKED